MLSTFEMFLMNLSWDMRGLGWYNHVCRMSDDTLPKLMLCGQVTGSLGLSGMMLCCLMCKSSTTVVTLTTGLSYEEVDLRHMYLQSKFTNVCYSPQPCWPAIAVADSCLLLASAVMRMIYRSLTGSSHTCFNLQSAKVGIFLLQVLHCCWIHLFLCELVDRLCATPSSKSARDMFMLGECRTPWTPWTTLRLSTQ